MNYSLEIALTLMLAHHSAFLQEFRNWESAWAMKALHTIAYDLRTIAEMVGFRTLNLFAQWDDYACHGYKSAFMSKWRLDG